MNPDIQPQKVNSLTIILVLDTNDVGPNLEALYADVQSLKLDKKTKVYVLVDSVSRMINPCKYLEYGLRIYELAYDTNSGITTAKPISIKGVNAQNGQAWAKAIKKIYKNIDADFRCLITWSHGAQIGITGLVSNSNLNYIRNLKGRKGDFPTKQLGDRVTKFENGICIQRKPGEDSCLSLQQLFISEIGERLKDVTTEKKFDFVIMCNCYTQVIDNCFNLNKIAHYYFAPVGLVDLAGYDFANFITHINANPINQCTAGYESYIEGIIEQLFRGYEKIPRHKSDAIVVTRLDEMENLRELLNPICNYLKDHKPVLFPVIAHVIKQKMRSYPDTAMFDMVVLFRLIREELVNVKLKTPAKKNLSTLLSAFEDLVSKRIVMKTMIGNSLSSGGLEVESFTVYLPFDNNEVPPIFECQYLKKYLNCLFIRRTRWDEFLREFISYWYQGKRQPCAN